jgi:hypothetical protein
MWTSAGQKAALLSPDGSRVLHLDGGEFCLLAPSQIGAWAEIACAKSTPANRPGEAADMFWSPAGDRLLMPTYHDGLQRFRDTDIRLFDPVTFSVENLTDDRFDDSLLQQKGPVNFDLAPRWVDGDTIAFIRYAIPAEGLRQVGPPSLMSIEIGGGEAKELLQFAAGRGIPISATAISADGKRLAYSVDGPDDAENLGVYLLDLAHPVPSLLAKREDIGPPPAGLGFSADGKYLLALGRKEEGDGLDARVIDLASGEIVPVDPVQNVVGVAWSPAGAALAYLTYDRTKGDMPGGLFLADAPGKRARLLIGGAFFPTVCCGQQPLIWAANDTMIMAQLGDKLGTVLFVRLGQ